MLITLLVAGAVGLGASGPLDKVEKARRLGPARVTQSCTAERCAVYVNGRRWGSTQSDDTGRVVVKDKRGRVIAKISKD
jgi:hypothetical protein